MPKNDDRLIRNLVVCAVLTAGMLTALFQVRELGQRVERLEALHPILKELGLWEME